MIKNSFGFILILLIICPKFVWAMKINEIMYDVAGTDTGREWVEVYNNTDKEVDISKWKLFENNVGHTLKIIKGSPIIQVGGYAIIADNDINFMADNPNFSGALFDSVFSLTNTGETLILLDSEGNKIDEIGYNDTLGAKGDGNSLQLFDGFLIPSIPTPGLENIKSSAPKTESTSTSTIPDISSHSSPKPIISPEQKVDFELSIGRDRVSSIKTPVIFEPFVGEEVSSRSARYLWNFGDGNQQKGRKVEHYYKHPGNYNVVLNVSYLKQHAVSRAEITIFKPSVLMSPKEDGLEIQNFGKNELNIGGWKIKSEDQQIKFTFPQDTIISANTSITFDKDLFIKNGEMVDFSNLNLNLYFPNGDIISL